MQLLAISGSLRGASSNTALVRAHVALAPAGVTVNVYEGLSALPHFNSDLDGDTVSPGVTDLRAQLRVAEGVITSTPEYAHDVPGSLKNALDW
jgi:NAD(P)H-dependent FMN reductase